MSEAVSLFDAPAEPVFSTGATWLSGLLVGTVATALCVIAIAFIGFMLMSGRLAVREAIRVTLGCFVLLGAPAIALGLQALAGDAAQTPASPTPIATATPPVQNLPPANYDPYAGASLQTR